MHTPAKVTIVNGSHAQLSQENPDASLYFDVIEPIAETEHPEGDQPYSYSLSAGPCRHFPQPQHSNNGITKLKITSQDLCSNTKARVVVRISVDPISNSTKLSVRPLEQWREHGPFV